MGFSNPWDALRLNHTKLSCTMADSLGLANDLGLIWA